jgi:hypothetical protein
MTRTALARATCARLGQSDGKGQARVVTARIDLARHVRAGRLVLPPVADPFVRKNGSARQWLGPARPRPSRAVAAAAGAAATTCQVWPSLVTLTVHRVTGPKDPWHAVWKRCLDEHHYLGAGKLCGAQLRYVVCAEDQVVAVASFSAAALKVRARDRYIGWSALACKRNRKLVVCQSRFCVTLRVKNLASRVQAILLRRLSFDWEEVHGVRPLLVESFLDAARFDGASYRAANWKEVGSTRGRGRQDRRHQWSAGKKRVFVYPLDRRFREILGVEPVHVLAPDPDWAAAEWGGVDLADRRLTKRLVAYGRARFERLTASLSETCGSAAATKGAYRLLNHESASLERFLSGPREATLARAATHPVVLAIQDTTSLNYTTHVATEGLGPIGSFGPTTTLGLEVHSLLVSTPTGTPLGVLDVKAWARDPTTYGEALQRNDLPTAKKESGNWLRGYAAADTAAERLGPNTKVVVVGDREADMFDLLAAATKGQAGLLVRAVRPRRMFTATGECQGLLWDHVCAAPIGGTTEVEVPRRGSRAACRITLDLRFQAVRVERPRNRSGDKPARAVEAWAIAAKESAASAGDGEPIEWLLLTTLPVKDAATAAEMVGWYRQRWLIEVFHRALKTGCRIERRQATTAETLKAALAIDAVVACRVMALVKLGREAPELPCSLRRRYARCSA